MILMISGRTDIVAYYTPWLLNRFKAGFVDVRNPINYHLVSRINFSDVDLILFCTKNPLPLIPYLKDIKIPILFDVTLTGYNKDIEPNVPDKAKIITGIKEISEIIGKENLYVRYDPILINERYSVNYHIKAFSKINTLLEGYVAKYIVSFIDMYKNVERHKETLNLIPITKEIETEIATNFSKIARTSNSTVQACAESADLLNYGFIKGECISLKEAYRLTGKLDFKSQKIRPNINCNCLQTVDIGAYNSCPNLCRYCYANYLEEEVSKNFKNHDPNSSLLIGQLEPTDIIKVRKK